MHKSKGSSFEGPGHKKILFLPSEVPFPMNTYRANLIIGVGGLETNARYKKILCVCVCRGQHSLRCVPDQWFFSGIFWSRGLSYVGGLKEGVVELAIGLCFYTQLNNLGRNLLVFEKKPRGFHLLRNANLRKQGGIYEPVAWKIRFDLSIKRQILTMLYRGQ